MCAYVYVYSLTRKERVGTGQASLVRGIFPAQPPQCAAAVLHGHKGWVMNPRELLTTPCGVTVTSHPHPWEVKVRKIWKRMRKREKSRGTCKGNVWLYCLKGCPICPKLCCFVILTLRAAWSTPALTAAPHCFVHHLALYLWRSEEDTYESPNIQKYYIYYTTNTQF